MFEVIRVTDLYVVLRVTLRALEDIQVSDPEIHVGRHGASIGKRDFRVREGAIMTLTYPGWSNMKLGERMSMSRLMMHPGVGRFVRKQRL